MTAPIWMASPPEVHSTLLSSGPGPGPLLASAATWSSLSVEYAETADELTALLDAVQAGSWDGPSAAEYAAAHAPYLAWLAQASADSATMAAQQDLAATAYTVALAAMPTMPELAANHAAHAVLTATNFFGINTIPIAVNEADYARMWVQAATVMSTYEGVATAAVATAPPAEPAPEVMKATALAATAEQSSSYPPDTQDQWMDWLEKTGFVDFYNRFIQPLIDQLMNNPFFQSMFSGFDPWLPSLGNPLSFLNPFNIAFALGYPMDFGSYFAYLGQMFSFVAADLAAAFASGNPATIAWTILFTTIEVIGTVITDTIALIKTLLEQMIVLIPLIVPLLTVAVVPLVVPTLIGGLAGLTGLAGLHAIPIVPIIPAPALVPVAPAPTPPPTPTPAPSPAPTPASTPAAAPASPAPGAPPPTPAGPPVAAMQGLGYMVGGLAADARRAASTSARARRAAAADAAEAEAVALPEEDATKKRRQRVKVSQLGRGYEYMDLEPEPATTASDRPAPTMGFAGTVPTKTAAAPAGLSALVVDEFDDGPRTPMMPGTWDTGATGSKT
ncbi:PPE family protein [Mycobacterium intracellulare ATCC 13950]|uniref:PPE family protein n=2 Tax=Mycobacterium intracellulare TaxID=1767 RepID=H8IWG9_MYCIA|nr:PPE family protein [Mycobacterium intracellulare]AFC42452.1 PPE family protein [Mycobacterium intracellulare ATCC 13950]